MLAGIARHGYCLGMHKANEKPTRQAAEDIAVQALAFLAEEPARLSRFLQLTGVAPADVRAQAQTPQFLGAVLEHILADESLLLSFTANACIAPRAVAPALALLQQSQSEVLP
jgi:Protein of unknown function (DUF3572)